MNPQTAVAEVVQAARNAKPPKENKPKCRYCNSQPMEFYVWRQVLQGGPEGQLVVLMACCKNCDREINTLLIAPNANGQPAEKQTAAGLWVPGR